MTKKPKLHLVGSDHVPTPPRELGEHGMRLWQSIQREYCIADIGGCELLAQAGAALDLAERCRAEIAETGLLVRTKTGTRENPLAKVELTARSAVCRIIRQLGLDVEPVKSPGRPPGASYGY
jgi:hypothetical protein